MIALLCALATGVCFHLSTGLGAVWPLAWLAPLPVLWLAYGEARTWKVAAAAFAAYLLGELNLFQAYAILGLPLMVMVAVIALAFAACALFARLAVRRLPPLAAAFAFPCAWTAWEYGSAMVSPHGAFSALANSQVGSPPLIQGASLFGAWWIGFLICAVASLAALAVRRPDRRLALGGLAVALFVANLGFGVWRLGQLQLAPVRVAALADDRLGRLAWTADRADAVAATTGYAARARALAKDAEFVVLPEKFAFLKPDYRADALAPLQAVADDTGAAIVAGFDDRRTRTNAALVLRRHASPYAYAKRRLIPGLESNYAIGPGAGVFAPGRAVAICKDMDFPQTLRSDARNHIGILLVPAWDFDSDGWSHARIAVLRGVEGGYAVVRSAQHGLATVSDAEGRVLARTTSAHGEPAVASVSPGPGDTLYVHIGDLFAWLCAAAAAALLLAALLRPARAAA
jgi:apolipoprotein N-acyltransferase